MVKLTVSSETTLITIHTAANANAMLMMMTLLVLTVDEIKSDSSGKWRQPRTFPSLLQRPRCRIAHTRAPIVDHHHGDEDTADYLW